MCLFCDIVSWKSPSQIVYRDDVVTAFFDYFPASYGHLLIVPNEHHENIFEIPEKTLMHLSKISKKISLVYRDILWTHNINILQNNGSQAWQSVFHYHMHIIPRTSWDRVSFWWEIDESHRDTHDKLKETLSQKLSN